ncbi:hypothetical protein [Pectobacterium versatile]|uniref:hypothetical protein n=1 Tax=Pectobacterium versatile TaxID=2488639 RepID=UPI000CFEF277|nr:hypothetical protein [Pectobacterium versatile]
MITVSLKEILDAGACKDGFLRVLHARGKITIEQRDELIEDGDIDGTDELPEEILSLADDEQFPAASVVTAEHIQDAIWALRVRPECKNLWRKYAVWCARRVQYLMKDERSIAALDVAWRHAEGLATDEEWDAARAAAWDAARAAARDAARAAARAAAWDAAWDAARDAARAAARDAARDAAWDAQTKKLIQILNAAEWVD